MGDFFKPKGIRELDRKRKQRKRLEKLAFKENVLKEKEKRLQQELRIQSLKTRIRTTKNKRGSGLFGIKNFNTSKASEQRGLLLGTDRPIKKKRNVKVGFDEDDFDILGGLI